MAKSRSTFAKQLKKTAARRQRAKVIPFRNLWKDGVTYSFLSEFLQCREQARLSYVEGYAKKGLVEAFEFGNCIHNCLEAFGKSQNTYVDYIQLLTKYKIDRSKQLNSTEREELNRIVETAKIVWPAYLNYWWGNKGMEFLPDCQFVALEEDFKFAHDLPDGQQIFLRGRFDGVLRYQKQLWLMENKTKSVIDERISEYLPHDMQTMMYAHCVEQKYGEPVVGVLYNVVRRPGLRQGKKETVYDLLQRISKDVGERPEFYFLRWNTYFDAQDVRRWVDRVLNPILANVVLWWKEIEVNPFDPWSIPNRVHHYISPTGFYTQYGRSNYFDILANGNNSDFYRRER